MALEFIKVDLTDNLESPWHISQNKIAPYAACMEKLEWTKLFTHQKREKINFLLRKPTATKHRPLSIVYYMEFYRILFIWI